MGLNSVIAFSKRDAGWSEADNKKARAMLLRETTSGQPRYTDEEVAAYMGMSVDYVARLRRNIRKPRPSVHSGEIDPKPRSG